MDTLFKIAIVGCPGLSGALLKEAPRLMPQVNTAWNIEYFSVIPHLDAADAVARIRKEMVDVILLGYPQERVSAWEITELIMGDVNRPPIILISLREVAWAEVNGKPTGHAEFRLGELDRICGEIQRLALAKRIPTA